MWASLTKQWFLISLGICFLLGALGTRWVQPLLEIELIRGVLVFSVMWAMGVTLRADMIRHSVARPLPSALAITINILVVPLICLPTAWLLPSTLFGGLFIAGIVPCTLASASVWTRKAGGNDSIAMMTTVVTNLACVVVVPLGVSMVLAETTEVSAAEQMRKLAMVVVAPLILAQVMRRCGLAGWADRQKPRLSMFGQCGILVMVIFGAAKGAASMQATMAADSAAEQVGWIDGGVMIVAAVAVHVIALWLGIVVSRRLGTPREGQIAVGIAGSQKTLMIGLQIAIDCGVSVVPMLVYHLGQLLIDTLVAERWRERSQAE